MLGHAKASMTLDIYADLFDEDLDGVADRLDTAIRSAADQLRTGRSATRSPANTDWLSSWQFSGGAKGIRTPDLLDANESRYQLRHSPWSVAQATSRGAAAETGGYAVDYWPAARGRS